MKFCFATTILSMTSLFSTSICGFQVTKKAFGVRSVRIEMASYLDQLSSPGEDDSSSSAPAPSGGSYLDALSGGGTAPAPVSEEPPAVASGGSYLDALSGGATAVPAPAVEEVVVVPAPPAAVVEEEPTSDPARSTGSYLDSMASSSSSVTSGSGPASYLDSMSSSTASSSPTGSGLTSYLDSVGGIDSSLTVVPAAAPTVPSSSPVVEHGGDGGLDGATRELLETVHQVETEFLTRLGQLTSEKETIQAQLGEVEMAKSAESTEKANLQHLLESKEAEIVSLTSEKDQGVSQVQAAILRLRKLIE